MSISEALFVPSLKMRWHWKGTSFELYRDGILLWSSVTYAVPWDYPCANDMAKILRNYINTPIADLKRGKVDHISIWSSWRDSEITAHFKLLVVMLMAADRRIGKNVQSLRLFVEPDVRVRNIIGRRI